ncbi:MAG: GIY-YIG nuclease family protein [bacterium]|nr:GIY-YIG nuclease family protein [bacterium]
MYYVYVLKNPKGVLYKGSTSDLNKRLDEHLSSKYKSFTRNRGPWELIYTEEYKSRKEAEKREKFFKSGKGRSFLKDLSSSRGGAIGSSQGS